MRTDAPIVADGRERLEAAVGELPAEERERAARRLGVDPGWARRSGGRDWLGRLLSPLMSPVVRRWLRHGWGGGVDRRLYAGLGGAAAGDGADRGGR